MSDDVRSIDLERIASGHYRATNARGGVVTVGSGGNAQFTPVELLLAGIAGCSAIDVDLIAGKRAQPESFRVRATGVKIRDEHGNRLTDLSVTFDLVYPAGPDGDAARAVLPRSLAQTRDRLCTVGRTVTVGTPIRYRLQRR